MCSMYERDSEEAMKQYRSLLTDPACDRAVRYGDIYGMMAEHYARLQHWKAVSGVVVLTCVDNISRFYRLQKHLKLVIRIHSKRSSMNMCYIQKCMALLTVKIFI